ncbi:hypothetical protein [Alteromonas sp. a30]|uniref:hypothetical protein n=1 Tax=Alteromonas sp. a30 TaxID=2730917 RepID=UPI00227FE937|nr:hypothetical protein [Alteromonas sp. a30]MCY7296170.1 hypothetical protein [Alteromonas sp. a30]
MKQLLTQQFVALRHFSFHMVWISLSLVAVLWSLNTDAKSQSALTRSANCILYYRLEGLALKEFTTQKQQLGSHLHRKKIALINIKSWHKNGLSGRERMHIQKRYDFPRRKDFAVLIDANGNKMKQYVDDVDLVSVLLDCKR